MRYANTLVGVLAGIIIGVFVILGIAYLQPAMLAQRGSSASPVIDADAFADSMRIVLHSDQREDDYLSDSGAVISTPLMRRAKRYQMRKAALTAIHRRRRGTVFHLFLLVVGIVVPFVAPVSHSWSLIPVALLIWWLILCRYSVVSVNRMIRRLDRSMQTSNDEQTIIICDEDGEPSVVVETERSIEITGILSDRLGSLLDPIPVKPTTYLSRPLLPRSVRTIDLSAPVSSSELGVPVTGGNMTVERRLASGE